MYMYLTGILATPTWFDVSDLQSVNMNIRLKIPSFKIKNRY